MSSRWSLSSETLSHRNRETPELRAHNGKTIKCGTMESCSHLPAVQHCGGDTEDGYTIYDSDGPKKAKTKTKNSLDRETQKRDNGKWCVTN